MQDIRKRAKDLMKNSCRVCPVCDGRVCAGEVPGMGGLGTAAAFRDNVRALAEIKLNMHLIHDVAEPSTEISCLGLDLSLPVIAAPIGGMFNFNDAVTEAEYIEAVLNGCISAGTVGCTGDGVPPSIIDSAMAAINKVDGQGIPFIKPWEGKELDDKLERAFSSGCTVMGMDIDAAGLITLRKMGRPVAPKPLKELTSLIERAHEVGISFILKGIMTQQDAFYALEAGADCIVVSNHGGRVFESAPGAARVLPEIAQVIDGKIPIMVDGGVRSGADVFKLIALGADIVGIGRPVSIAAIGGGSDGVAMYFNQIKNELVQTMVLTGCKEIASITGSSLFTELV